MRPETQSFISELADLCERHEIQISPALHGEGLHIIASCGEDYLIGSTVEEMRAAVEEAKIHMHARQLEDEVLNKLKNAGLPAMEEVALQSENCPHALELGLWLLTRRLFLEMSHRYREEKGEEVYDFSEFVVRMRHDGTMIARIMSWEVPGATLETGED